FSNRQSATTSTVLDADTLSYAGRKFAVGGSVAPPRGLQGPWSVIWRLDLDRFATNLNGWPEEPVPTKQVEMPTTGDHPGSVDYRLSPGRSSRHSPAAV